MSPTAEPRRVKVDHRNIAILYGSGDTAAINFSAPVYVTSIWVGASGDGSPADDRLVGSLGGATQFTINSPVTSTGSGSWQQVTGGATSQSIDWSLAAFTESWKNCGTATHWAATTVTSSGDPFAGWRLGPLAEERF